MSRRSGGQGRSSALGCEIATSERRLKDKSEAERVRSTCVWRRRTIAQGVDRHRVEIDVVGCRPPSSHRAPERLAERRSLVAAVAWTRAVRRAAGVVCGCGGKDQAHLTLLGRERRACDGCAGTKYYSQMPQPPRAMSAASMYSRCPMPTPCTKAFQQQDDRCPRARRAAAMMSSQRGEICFGTTREQENRWRPEHKPNPPLHQGSQRAGQPSPPPRRGRLTLHRSWDAGASVWVLDQSLPLTHAARREQASRGKGRAVVCCGDAARGRSLSGIGHLWSNEVQNSSSYGHHVCAGAVSARPHSSFPRLATVGLSRCVGTAAALTNARRVDLASTHLELNSKTRCRRDQSGPKLTHTFPLYAFIYVGLSNAFLKYSGHQRQRRREGSHAPRCHGVSSALRVREIARKLHSVGFAFDRRVDWAGDLFELSGATSPHRLRAAPGMCAAGVMAADSMIVDGNHATEQEAVLHFVSVLSSRMEGSLGCILSSAANCIEKTLLLMPLHVTRLNGDSVLMALFFVNCHGVTSTRSIEIF